MTIVVDGNKLPLAGIRVIDFCWAVAGPVTTKFLALLGAEVIKIESRSRLDGARMGTPFLEGKPGVNKSGYFGNHNTSKLSVRMDMTKPEARKITQRLVEKADVVSESFSAGVINSWGLGYKELVKYKPDLIMISLTMQGQTGPFHSHVGFGRTLSGLAGIDHLTGWPGSNPSGPNQPYTDLVVPWFGVTALISALRERNSTGAGQYIDLSQLEVTQHFLAPAVLDFHVNGRIQMRNGNRSNSAAPHAVYQCRGEDRWCAITVFTDAQWRQLCEVMDQPELIGDKRFKTLLMRKSNEMELDQVVGSWCKELEVEEVVKRLMNVGIPAAIVENGRDLHHDRQLNHRMHFKRLEHSIMGVRTHTAPSFRLSDWDICHEAAPLLGEHDDYVFREVLGMKTEEINQLRDEGVFN